MKHLGTWHGQSIDLNEDGTVIVAGMHFSRKDMRDLRDDLAGWLTRRGVDVPRYPALPRGFGDPGYRGDGSRT